MKIKRWIGNLILVVCVLLCVGSGGYLLRYYWSIKNTENAVEQLRKYREEGQNEPDDGENIPLESGHSVSQKYKKLYKKNKDMIGWIQIKNTKINYPVMQTKKDSQYYLHRNFEKMSDVNGLPFLDAGCDLDDEEGNLMIYGHHMKSGLMFAHLTDYQNEKFYRSHSGIELDTLYESRKYKVIAAFYSQIYPQEQDVFKYYEYIGHLSKKEYDKYVKNIRKLSLYDTGVIPEYGQQLLTLVTCAYHTEEGRFVVVAVQEKDGETNE